MVNVVMLVFIGGALGAVLREFSMLMVPNLADNFPLDILVANLVAAFLLGLVTSLHRRQIVPEGAEMLVLAWRNQSQRALAMRPCEKSA